MTDADRPRAARAGGRTDAAQSQARQCQSIGPPTLTDALGVDRDAPLAPTIILPESVVAEADPIALDTLSDLPVLTDVVDVWPSAASEVSPPSAEDELSPATLDDALEADALAAPSMRRSERTEGEATPSVPVVSAYEAPETEATPSEPAVSATTHRRRRQLRASPPFRRTCDGARRASAVERRTKRCLRHLRLPCADEEPAQPTASGAVAAVESHGASALLDEEFILDIPPAPAAASGRRRRRADRRCPSSLRIAAELVPGSREWEALAEEIRMQVLQRLDLFTDTGMRDQLGARLQPIVDRASAGLVETINQRARRAACAATSRKRSSARSRAGASAADSDA